MAMFVLNPFLLQLSELQILNKKSNLNTKINELIIIHARELLLIFCKLETIFLFLYILGKFLTLTEVWTFLKK